MIGLALLASQIAVFGPPAWPAVSGPDKLPWLFTAILLGGLAVDRLRPGLPLAVLLSAAAVAAMSLWLAWPQLGRGGSALPPLLLTAAALGLACIGGLAATTAAGASRVSVVVMSALALAGAAFQAGSLSLMQVALSLAAASGGFALWNWPRGQWVPPVSRRRCGAEGVERRR